MLFLGLPQWLSGKESACDVGVAGDAGLIPGWERCPGGGHGNPVQCSCLENPMDRRAWQATVHGVTKSWTGLKGLSMHECYAAVSYLKMMLYGRSLTIYVVLYT